MTDEERLFVVVCVDEPAGDPFRPVAAYLSRVGMEHVHAVDPFLDLVVVCVEDVDVQLPYDVRLGGRQASPLLSSPSRITKAKVLPTSRRFLAYSGDS